MRRTVIVLLSLTVAASRQSLTVAAAKESYWAYSSCPVSASTDWAKARPYKLKSWLGSTVPGM